MPFALTTGAAGGRMCDNGPMGLPAADLERVFMLARELAAAGRRQDAELLARLAAEASAALAPDLSAAALEGVLEQGEADIAAGRFLSDEALWARIEASQQLKQPS